MAKPKGKKLKPQYDAAEEFVERVLTLRDSLFTPGQPVWSDATVQDLYHRFVELPDTSGESFETKFEKQLTGAPPATIQLAGELLFVHLLSGNSTSGEKKRSLINTVLGWSTSPVTIPAELDEALDEGLAAEGMGFKIHRPFLLQYLLEFVRKWWSLGEDDRSQALDDPWAFKKVAMSVKVPKSYSQREILLHLVHPESFESIMSRDHKQKIAEGFASLVDEPTEDVDRKLLQIHDKLREREGREISFYEPRLIVVWQPEADPWGQFVKFAALVYGMPNFDERERNYKLRLADKAKPAIEGLTGSIDAGIDQFQSVMRTKNADLTQNIVRWQDYEPFLKWYRDSLPISHLAVSTIRDTTRPVGERIRKFLELVPKSVVKSNASRTTLASFFLFAFDPKNLVVFRSTPFEWAYERVDYPSTAEDADEASRYEHALGFVDRFLNEAAQRGLKLRDRLDAQGVLWCLASMEERPDGMSQDDWEEFVLYQGGKPILIDGETDDEEDRTRLPKPTVVGGSVVESDRVGRLVLRRKNIVLYGPPGTGKTHASLNLAEKWRRQFGDDSVLQVTFHPTFAYEDFIEGFRPDASGRFERRDGIFVQACQLAMKNPGRQFLLVIDELNRGDVARLFGELITLIEPDKRHAGVSRKLPYSQREFWVPPNLHLLGTMNTADRSISLLDVAIRRRFCFVEYPPDPMAIEMSTAHHRELDKVRLSDLMTAINLRLQSVGVDRDKAVGHSHFLIPLSEKQPIEVLRERIRYDIIPLVEEYCYADRSLLRKVFGELVADDGLVDDEVLNDDQSFVDAVRLIVDGSKKVAPAHA